MVTNLQQPTLNLLDNRQTDCSAEEILNSIVKFECLEEILELVDLGKRREATLYSEDYRNAVGAYITNFDFKNKDLSSFDQFTMQLILTGSSLHDQSLKFYQNLNRLAVSTINALYNLKASTLKMQSAMYHMQMTAGEASAHINELEENDFYINKARQHFVMAVNFVQEISVHKAFESQCRVSDMDIQLLLNNNSSQTIEQAIVDTHNAVEFGKFVHHRGVPPMLERYSDLCDLLSDSRPEERAYWTEFSQELKAQAETF
jgi:hypothetical protein